MEIIYRIKNYLYKTIFFKIKNIKYKKKYNKYQKNSNLTKGIFKNFIKQLGPVIFNIIIIVAIDYVIISLIKNLDNEIINSIKSIVNLKIDIFYQFLICGIGVAGVFLALYYSNISAVYSNQYANSPNQIRLLFEKEITNNNAIAKLNRYIILSILLIFLMIINIKVWYFSIFIMIINTIQIIINFTILGNKIYEFSDEYNVLENSRKNLNFYIKSATNEGYQFDEISFQNYYGKASKEILENLKITNEYVLSDKKNLKDNSVLNFLINNIFLIANYLKQKNRIFYDSLWFQYEIQYKRWYETSFLETSTALRTGTELSYKYLKNRDWIEKEILDINNNCIDNLFETSNTNMIISYLTYYNSLIKIWIQFGNIELLYENIRDITNKTYNYVYKKNHYSKSDYDLLQAISVLYINFILECKTYLNNISLNTLNRFEKIHYKYSKKNFLDFNDKVLNCESFYRVFKSIDNEIKIERKKITPQWYIKQRVSDLYMKEFNMVLKQIEAIYNLNLTMGKNLSEAKLYEYADIFIMNENEMNNKIEFIKELLTFKENELNKNYTEKSYKFEESKLNNFYNFIEQKHKEIPNLWIKSATIWGLQEYHTAKEKDIFGFCYNNLIEYVFNCIISFDFEEFNKFYKEIFSLSVLSETIIHEDIELKENISNSYKFQFQTSGLCSLFEISGYAILLGEILKDKRWLETIRTVTKNFFDKLENERANTIFDKWIKIIELDEGNIFKFDSMKNINWESRFTNSIQESQKLEFEEIGMFGNKRVINTKMLKEIYYDGDFRGFYVNPKEIFAIACLNKMQIGTIRYKNDKNKIQEWVDMDEE